MSTIAAKTSTTRVAKEKIDILAKVFGDYEAKRFAITPFMLIWTVCLGGVAVGLGAMESIPMLTSIVFPAMAILAFCLAVQPVRSIIWLTIVATSIDLILIVTLLIG